MWYKIIRSVFFLFDAEKVHYFAMNALKHMCNIPFLRTILSRCFAAPAGIRPVQIWNLHFPNPVGLAAGFDKNALYLRELETLGFGFVEIGTVTPQPQDGNEKPRLFRLPQDKAIINRMGFNNDGVKVIKERLKKWASLREQTAGNLVKGATDKERLIIGGNIGKNKVTPNEEAWKDYEICFSELYDYVDYFVVNVSSPNTPGLRALQEKESLRKILSHLQLLRLNYTVQKPILLKIAPDLTREQIDDVVDLAREIQLDGLVATNTTISREGLSKQSEATAKEAGGLSGLPVKKKSTEIVQYIHEKTKGTLPVIASGGIFNAADANEKLQAGASLIQIWTGFIYEGPSIARTITKGLKQPTT